jgi:hypothetical protein
MYRQAMEYVVDAHAMSTLAEDARLHQRWLEVRQLSPDAQLGATKAARNAALSVMDTFIAHAQKRDDCGRIQEPIRPRATQRAAESKRDRLIGAKKALEAAVRYCDPELLLAQGNLTDEYDIEVTELLQLITNEQKQVTAQSVLDVFSPTFPIASSKPSAASLKD